MHSLPEILAAHTFPNRFDERPPSG